MNENHRQLLVKAAQVMRQQQKQIDWLTDQLANSMHKENCSKFANELVQRGIYSQEEMDKVVEKVSKVRHLDAVRQAVEIVQPKTDMSIGSVEKVASEADEKLLEDPAVEYLLSL